MCSIVIRCIWLILPILRLRKTRNCFYTKTRLCLEEHRRTSQTAGEQASGLCIFVLFNRRLPSAPGWADRCGWELCRDSTPVAYLPIFFPVFIFSFVNCYSNCSKIAFQLARIYNYLVWNVTFEVTAI